MVLVMLFLFREKKLRDNHFALLIMFFRQLVRVFLKQTTLPAHLVGAPYLIFRKLRKKFVPLPVI